MFLPIKCGTLSPLPSLHFLSYGFHSVTMSLTLSQTAILTSPVDCLTGLSSISCLKYNLEFCLPPNLSLFQSALSPRGPPYTQLFEKNTESHPYVVPFTFHIQFITQIYSFHFLYISEPSITVICFLSHITQSLTWMTAAVSKLTPLPLLPPFIHSSAKSACFFKVKSHFAAWMNCGLFTMGKKVLWSVIPTSLCASI